MGLPVGRLMIATNANDILARTLATGSYEVRGVAPTTSPSMDIQVSSNFERLLFEALDRDAASVNRLMAGLKQSGAFTLDERTWRASAPSSTPRRCPRTRSWPRSATSTGAPARSSIRTAPSACAPPASARRRSGDARGGARHRACREFPDAVEAATGVRPALPPHLADLLERRERFTVLPNDEAAVERAIRERARILKSAA